MLGTGGRVGRAIYSLLELVLLVAFIFVLLFIILPRGVELELGVMVGEEEGVLLPVLALLKLWIREAIEDF